MYKINILRKAIKDIESIPKSYQNIIGQHINSLANNPRPLDAKKLKDGSGYSQRAGVYRILYNIDDSAKLIIIYRIKHRSNAYDN